MSDQRSRIAVEARAEQVRFLHDYGKPAVTQTALADLLALAKSGRTHPEARILAYATVAEFLKEEDRSDEADALLQLSVSIFEESGLPYAEVEPVLAQGGREPELRRRVFATLASRVTIDIAALIELATSLREDTSDKEAIEWGWQVVHLIASNDGPNASTLVEPLKAVAKKHEEAKHYEAALVVWRRLRRLLEASTAGSAVVRIVDANIVRNELELLPPNHAETHTRLHDLSPAIEQLLIPLTDDSHERGDALLDQLLSIARLLEKIDSDQAARIYDFVIAQSRRIRGGTALLANWTFGAALALSVHRGAARAATAVAVQMLETADTRSVSPEDAQDLRSNAAGILSALAEGQQWDLAVTLLPPLLAVGESPSRVRLHRKVYSPAVRTYLALGRIN